MQGCQGDQSGQGGQGGQGGQSGQGGQGGKGAHRARVARVAKVARVARVARVAEGRGTMGQGYKGARSEKWITTAVFTSTLDRKVCGFLFNGCSVSLNNFNGLVFLEANRVIVNVHVIYSRIYEKMKKHCGCAVLLEDNRGNYMAFVEYFLFESNLKAVCAVIKRIILDFENPFLVCDKPLHLLRI